MLDVIREEDEDEAEMTSATEKAAATGEWREVVTRAYVVRTPLRTLSVNVSELGEGSWVVSAIEVSTAAALDLLREPEAATVALYDDHGHKVVGERSTLEGAKAAAEAYAWMWARERAKVDACGCEGIA